MLRAHSLDSICHAIAKPLHGICCPMCPSTELKIPCFCCLLFIIFLIIEYSTINRIQISLKTIFYQRGQCSKLFFISVDYFQNYFLLAWTTFKTIFYWHGQCSKLFFISVDDIQNYFSKLSFISVDNDQNYFLLAWTMFKTIFYQRGQRSKLFFISVDNIQNISKSNFVFKQLTVPKYNAVTELFACCYASCSSGHSSSPSQKYSRV